MALLGKRSGGTAAPTVVSHTHDRQAHRMSSAGTNRYRNGNADSIREARCQRTFPGGNRSSAGF